MELVIVGAAAMALTGPMHALIWWLTKRKRVRKEDFEREEVKCHVARAIHRGGVTVRGHPRANEANSPALTCAGAELRRVNEQCFVDAASLALSRRLSVECSDVICSAIVVATSL